MLKCRYRTHWGRGKHNVRMARPASEVFEIEKFVFGVDRQRRWKLLRLWSFLAGDTSPSWPATRQKIHLTIRQKAGGDVIFESSPADPDVVALAERNLATLDEDDFRRSWASP